MTWLFLLSIASAAPLHWTGSLPTSPPVAVEADFQGPANSKTIALSFKGKTEWTVNLTTTVRATERHESLSVTNTHRGDTLTSGWDMVIGDLEVFAPHENNAIEASQAEVTRLLMGMRKQFRKGKKASSGAPWRIDVEELRAVLTAAKSLAQALDSAPAAPPDVPLSATTDDERPLAARACPSSGHQQELADGATVRSHPSLLCYQEPHPNDNATVYYAVEGSVRQDSWGRYPRMVRQILVAWESGDTAWEVRFVTDPRSDARGVTLWKRDGQELLEIRRTRDGQTLETARFVMFSMLDGTGLEREESNFFTVPNPRVERLFERLRNVGYRGHRQLLGYIVDSDQPPNAKPVVIKDDDLALLIEIVMEMAEED